MSGRKSSFIDRWLTTSRPSDVIPLIALCALLLAIVAASVP